MNEPTNPKARQAFEESVEASLRGDREMAIAALTRAIEWEPACPLTHYAIGAHYYDSGSVQESASALSEAIRLEPRFAAAYVLRAQCYERLGERAKAISDRGKGLALPGPKQVDLLDRFSISLYSEPFQNEGRKAGVDVDAMLDRIAEKPGARVLRYPDGTVQLEGKGVKSVFETAVGSRVRDRAIQLAHGEDPLRMRMLLGGTGYVSLEPFPARMFEVFLWAEFVKQNDVGLKVQPGIVVLPVDGKVNGPIDNLPVTVAFRRRFSKKTRQQLAEQIGAYLASVRTQGLFGDGPVARVSETIDFFPRVAQFRIDASRSGQNTINWLLLSLIAFSSVNVVTEIHFTEQWNAEFTFERYFGLSDEKRTEVRIPEDPEWPELCEAKPRSSGRPKLRLLQADQDLAVDTCHDDNTARDAGAFLDVTSDYFPILTRRVFEPDNMTVTVFFEELPRLGEREPFLDSIRSWLKLGQLGAFGAPGLGYCGEVEFDTEHESASFFSDMGTTDMELALRILVNTLEGWHTHGIVINRLELGTE